MFWNKKEEKKEIVVEMKPKTTVLYNRIEKLYNRLQELNHNGVYKSELGERRFEITKERFYDASLSCYQCSLVNYYKVIFSNENIKTKETKFWNGYKYIVDVPQNIFILELFKQNTKIKPCPINLSAHEIDLAILEFENYIEKIYQEHKAKIKDLKG